MAGCSLHCARIGLVCVATATPSPRESGSLPSSFSSCARLLASVALSATVVLRPFLAEFPASQTQIRHWLTLGLKASSSRTAETCRRLLAADANLWRFVSVPGLEPTNNSAERALRHPVIWRRNSHGTQSDGGSRFVERILTTVETCRQQQRPVFDFLRDALIAYRTGQPAPSLLPAH